MTHTDELTIRRLLNEIPAYSADVTSLLPPDWQHQLRECSATHSRWHILSGGSTTSREGSFPDTAEARVGVVTGDIVAAEIPWLDRLYRTDFLNLVNGLGHGRFAPSSDLQAGVNINATPKDARYEWHVDSNPMTGLLFGTNQPPEDGGQLVFRPDPLSRAGETWELSVSPSAGTLLMFDARQAAHVVTRLHRGLRISVPMNYYYFEGREERPDDLNSYLYS